VIDKPDMPLFGLRPWATNPQREATDPRAARLVEEEPRDPGQGADFDGWLEATQSARDYGGEIVHVERLAQRPARHADPAQPLPGTLRSALDALGIARLYTHQAQAIDHVRAGRSVAEVLHATRFEHPPALSGSSTVAAVDRVIRRALAKRPDERQASADIMAAELRAIRVVDSGATPALAHALTRLVVLPFRVLRPDPETDFLAFSLPDAIATSLSGISSLVLRSSAS